MANKEMSLVSKVRLYRVSILMVFLLQLALLLII